MTNISELTTYLTSKEHWYFFSALLFCATLLIHIVFKNISNKLRNKFKKTKTLWDDALISAMYLPVITAIWIIGLNYNWEITCKALGYDWILLSTNKKEMLIVAMIGWVCMRHVKEIENNLLLHPKIEQFGIDATTAQALGKLANLVIIMLTILVEMQIYGISISGLLAFGGMGGLAVGFAAQSMLANFCGSLMIFMDRPFSIGDWVRSPDRDIEGIVEYIGWRHTRVRTFDQRPLYIPNATFNNISIENPSRMHNRRIREIIGIRYCDSKLMQSILKEIRQYLKNSNDIAHNRITMVNFTSFAASSLDIIIYCFTKTTDWATFERTKEKVLLDILGIIHKNGADVAFPTTTLDINEPLTINSDNISKKTVDTLEVGKV